MNIELKLNGGNGVFQLLNEDALVIGELTFLLRDDNQMIVNHTGVNPVYRGQGLAEKLVLKSVDYARDNKLKILPFCSYVSAYFSNHPEVQDVV
jgi:uncharacterized protein